MCNKSMLINFCDFLSNNDLCKIQNLGGVKWIKDKINLEDEYLELKRLNMLEIKTLDKLNSELCEENEKLLQTIKKLKLNETIPKPTM